MLTMRLELRFPFETDRARFVELFCDEAFMVFSGVLDQPDAHRRFDDMLERADELPFAKQPVIERRTGTIVGYVGVDWMKIEGERRLELGYRLTPEARGSGYATEAGQAILETAAETFSGEILAIIQPTNQPSQNVARALGFSFWKTAVVDGTTYDLHRLQIDHDASR